MAVTRTSNTIHLTSQNDAVSQKLIIRGIYPSGQTDAQICEIKAPDTSGNVIFKATGDSGGIVPPLTGVRLFVDGIALTDLDGGYVTIYIE